LDVDIYSNFGLGRCARRRDRRIHFKHGLVKATALGAETGYGLGYYAVVRHASREDADIILNCARKMHAALDEDKRKIVDEKDEANYINYSSAMTTYWQLQEISKLVFSMEVFERMEAVKNSFRALLAESIECEGNVSHKFNDNFKLLKANQEDLSRRIKAELKI
jgi:hypothetical protein